MEEKKMDLKYYIGILCAVTLVVGATAGLSVSSAANEEINEITKIVSMEDVMEGLEAKGLEFTVDGDTITTYKEVSGKTMTITIECPDGECQFQKPEMADGKKPCYEMCKRHFKFRMHGDWDMEAVAAKIQAAVEAGKITAEEGEAKLEWMEQNGFKGCPMRQEVSE
jgi:hypothetical protein